jgi:P4 family phage/plasmid primase-like protien
VGQLIVDSLHGEKNGNTADVIRGLLADEIVAHKPGANGDCRDVAACWRRRAEELADWTERRMVNRRDIHGRYYLGDGGKVNVTTSHETLTRALIVRHYQAKAIGDVLGLHTTARIILDEGNESIEQKRIESCVSLWGAGDIDQHGEIDFSRANEAAAIAWYDVLVGLGFHPLLTDSNGKGGFHLRVLFEDPSATSHVRQLFRWLFRDWEARGLEHEPEVFPKQNTIALEGPGSCGNWLRLPGRHPKRNCWARVWDGSEWLEGDDAIDFMLDLTGDSARLIPNEALAWEPEGDRQTSSRAGEPKSADDVQFAREALGYLGAGVKDQRGREFLSDYAQWLTIGMALFDLGDVGLELWEEWSKQSPKHEDSGLNSCGAKWETFKAAASNGVGLGTLFFHAKAHGWPGFPEKPKPPDELDAKLAKKARTDLGNGERLVARFGTNVRFCHPWKKWLVWDGQRWKADDTAVIQRIGKRTVKAILREAATLEDDDETKAHNQFWHASEAKARIDAMLSMASSENGVPILPDDMDKDHFLLNVKNGTIDLRGGVLRPHRREDLITRLAPVEFRKGATCPTWIGVLEKIFASDTGLINFWKMLCGVCLTGDVSNQILPVLYGAGANGKSTILNALLEILGPDYAIAAPPGLLTLKKGERHPTELASLFSKRLVVDSETAEGAQFNETLVKQLTGGDKISARRMKEDFWEFKPTHKILMCTNHKPEIRETKNAIWRRVKLVPFNVTIPTDEQDARLPDKLRAEYPGILAWCVEGCLDWIELGLEIPTAVEDATKEYRRESDVLAEFLASECSVIDTLETRASSLYARYQKWAGDEALNQRRFGRAMTERGFQRIPNNGTVYKGIGLRPDFTTQATGNAYVK